MMRRTLISVCTGALILVFAGLIIGDKLDLVSGVEFSEDALRQGLHRTISPQTAPLADMMNLAQRQATIAAIRSSTCADDQHYVSPFEGSNRRGDLGRVETGVADVLSGRWTLDSQKIDITRRDDPIYLASLSRGARYAVHAHQFLDKVMVLITLKHEDASEKRRLLLYSAQALADYANGHFFTNNDYRTDQSGEFSWYDMGAGQRASLLGFAVSHATCESGIPDEVIETLIRFAADHLYYLSTDTYFVSHNNHGIYQSIGLITLCKYVRVLKGCGIATELSLSRLQAMLDDDFVNGFHKEHSPAYHKDMLKALSGLSSLLPQEHPLAERLIDLHIDVYANLAWFVRPDRSLVQFGDTNYYTLSPLSEDSSDDAMPAALRWLLSDGGEGWAQGSALLDDTAAGYGIVRHIQAGGRPSEASYLALSAGFHSRTHKHADDLTFVWSEGQHNILIDSGRYSYARKAPPTPEMNSMGFWYDDPKRMYVESTHAHNTIEMDGAPIPRTDDGPYGSGVDTGFEAGTGLYVLQAAVTREDGAFHRRALVLDVSVGLLVLDWIRGGDGDGHDYTQWFHFAPEYELIERAADRVTLLGERDRIQVLSPGAQDIVADRGRTEPRLSGWHSRSAGSFDPNWAIGFRRTGATAWYATVFTRASQVLAMVDVERDEQDGVPTSVTLRFADDRVLTYILTLGPQGSVVGLMREGDSR